ncbi:HNH endonuclease [Marinomonas mediterranea]|uniref:HNH endonuclease n=1 Tax=Marinomonas mediterranea TaxID=119864 RepID=UPI00234963EB|nr:HNH endonuclease [Marinomonas mediterranea]WCN14765.1 HNH endonuclease [Marinomonas mediterranea]
MRPVRKGSSPTQGDFDQYEDAKPDLISRLGEYCSYCERRIPTNLAIEHLEPKKGVYGKPELERKWSNFLLACVNCNSTKRDKQVEFDQLFFPDRDNTFYAFEYLPDGTVKPANSLSLRNKKIANNILRLVGLDKTDTNRFRQRMSAWMNAESSKALLNTTDTPLLRNHIANVSAKSVGYFSVWMRVFENDSDMISRLIQAFEGTAESGCFNITTGEPVTPSPNLDQLENGGKV